MKDFFSTLFKWNWANVGKAVVGVATGIMGAVAFGAVFPAAVLTVAGTIVSIGTVFGITAGATATLGLHAAHVAEPPKTSDQIGK